MSVSWTTEQQQVIDLRKRNILVAAAAGSGKDRGASGAYHPYDHRRNGTGGH